MSLPAPGDVLAVTVARGVEALLRVVAQHDDAVCIVATRVSGPPRRAVPRTPALFEVQPLDHHAWKRPLLGGWVREPAPRTVRVLGRAAVRELEAARVLHPSLWVKQPVKTAADARRVLPVTSWDALVADLTHQWRWDHRRAEVLAEDAARARAQEDTFAQALARHAQQRQRLVDGGVAALGRKRFFAAWKGSAPPKLIREAEGLIRQAVTALEGRTPAQATRTLVSVVKAFNQLDGAHGHHFDTTDAEDIMEALGTLALACGVDDETFDARVDAARAF